MKKSTHSSVHLTMNLRVGTTIRVDALLSVNKFQGGGAERVNIREVNSLVDNDGTADAVISLVEKAMSRVGAELRSRGCEATAEELEKLFRDQVPTGDSTLEEQNLFGAIDWIGEISKHYFTEVTNEPNSATIAGNSNSSNS